MATQSAFTTTKTVVFPGGPLRKGRSTGGRGMFVGLLLIMALVGCDRASQAPDQATLPSTEAPAEVPAEVPTEPAPTVEPPPETTPAPVAQAPSTTAPGQSEPLPDTLVNQWEPMSNVLLAFGPMTVTAGDITWGSGQRSAYTLISTEGGFLLKLEANPSFYDTINPYVKLIPKTDETGAVTTVEVAFYEGEAQAQRDEYIMYGSYFVN
jgi:glucose/arabinose dehydrogenase